MRNKTFASLAVASALGLLTPAAHAFGLGKLELHSALNDPFKAEIAVTALQGEEIDNLQVKLASNQEFEKAGLERNFVLMGLEFDVIQEQGVTYISVSSERPIKEPLLDFLVIATTGEGRLIREYTVLLDPPKYVLTKPAKQPTPQTKTKTGEKAKTTTPAKKVQTTSYNYGQTTQATYNSNTYGPIAKRDTLWDIALKTRPEKSLSVNQMMMALLDANPNAFHRNNINGLNAGVTLDIPSLDAIKQLSKAAATTAVVEQNTQWKNKNKIQAASISTEIISVETTGTEVQAIDEQETVKVDDSVSADIENEEVTSRLKLVVPSDDESLNDDMLSPQGDEELSQLSEQLTFAQETIEAQAQENIDFKARMQAMEEQLETMRRILELKDPDLARLQSMLQEEQASESVDGNAQAIVEEALAVLEQNPEELEPAVAVEDELEIDKNTAEENIEEYLNSLNSDQDVDESVIESAAPEINTDEVEDESVLPTVDDVVKTTSELLNVDEAEIQDLISQVKTYVAENKMPTMLASLLILLTIWLLIRRRNRPNVSWDEAIEKYDVDDSSSSVDIAVADTSADNEQIELDETSVDEQEEVVNEKTVDDLIKQADMFVGYADYTQAKSSLEQANLLEPDNRRVTSKMCFVLYKQNNVNEFINLVKQSDFDTTSTEWADIAEWGRELAPENELFLAEELVDLNEEIDLSPEAALPLDEPEPEAEHLEFNLDDFETKDLDASSEEQIIEEPENEEQIDFETTNDDELMTFDLASDNESDEEEEQQQQEEETETSPEFDAPLNLDIETEESGDDANLDVADLSLDIDEEDDTSFEFESLDLDEPAIDDIDEQNELSALAENELEEADKELSNSAIVEFDLDDIDEIDEAETKLDLASAYIDMGDPDGAKSILEEVLKEGNDEQQSRAKKLLDDLS
jgi:pilus assembly protein FimV